MLFSIAYRNIIRARRRTVVTIVLSTISTAFFIFYVSMMEGSYSKIFKDSVEIYPSYIQITGLNYRDDPGYENLIFDTKSVVEKISKIDGIELAASRFEGFMLYASSENSVGGMLVGVEPNSEPRLSKIPKTLSEGEYLSANDTDKIIIGKKLAKKLNVKLGDTVSIVGSAIDYSFAADNLIIKGIFRTGLDEFDGNAAFINKEYLDEILLSQNISTHIIVLPKNRADSIEIAKKIEQTLQTSEYEVQEWHKYLEGVIKAMEFDKYSGIITMWLFLIVIFFVIMIYALLTIYSRIKEIGIMRAVGTTPLEIFYILMLETVLLGFASVVIGGIIGGYLSYYFQIHPIYLESFEETYRQYGILEAVLPAAFSWKIVFEGMGFIMIMNIISAIYPIIKVNSFKPIEAIRHR